MHIILNGSCPKCQQETHVFEGQFAGVLYGELRRTLQYPLNSKQRKRRVKEVEIGFDSRGKSETRTIPVEHELPGPVFAPLLPPAGILCGRPETADVPIKLLWKSILRNDQMERYRKHREDGIEGIRTKGKYSVDPLLKVLAKIAHGFAVTEFGMDGFSHFIPDRLLGHMAPEGLHGKPRPLTHLIGSTPMRFPRPCNPSLNDQDYSVMVGIREVDCIDYVVVCVQLFRSIDFPVYEVVAGAATRDLMRKLSLMNELHCL